MNSPKSSNLFMILTMLCPVFITPIIISTISVVGTLLGYPNALLDYLWLIQIIGSLSFLVFPLIFVCIFNKNTFKDFKLKEVVPFNKLSIKNILLIILISLFMQPLLSFVSSITNIFQADEIADTLNTLTNFNYLQVILAVAIVPAFIEEIIFRGIILSGYKKNTLWVGILMSSLYFGFIHFTISQLFYTIIGGIIFAFLVKATKSIWAGILAHFVLNASQITMLFILNNSSYMQESLNAATGPAYQEILLYSNIITVISAGFLFLISLPFLIFFIFLFIKTNKETLTAYKLEDAKIKENPTETPKVITKSFYVILIIYIGYMLFTRLLLGFYL